MSTSLFVMVAIEAGSVVVPVDSIIVIQDTDDDTCRVIYDGPDGPCGFDTTERAAEICMRINRLLHNNAVMLLDPVARARGQA